MCGIFACLARGKPLTLGDIVAANNAARHRGPDDEGYVVINHGSASPLGGDETTSGAFSVELPYAANSHWSTGKDEPFDIALGQRRLSVVDLSAAGHQPMCDPTQRVWLTYNGEIYNYRELRDELQAAGFQFRSDTDTEVVIAAYQKWGDDCLRRFNGMWAFVLVDVPRQRIFAATDRFGIKPLYVWSSPSGNLFFASELKQFERLPEWSPRLHVAAGHEFLVNGRFNHVRQSLVESVEKLVGGESCTVSLDPYKQNAPTFCKWYTLRDETTYEGSIENGAAEFRDLFTDSIRLRLRADVKVGSCLSGGLDSSSIVCVANQILDESGATEQQETISSCYDDPRFDERGYISSVVDSLNVRANYVFPTLDQLLERSVDLAWQLDGPFVSGSIFSQWNVFRKARECGLTVMLDGQGADEQLAGYHKYFPYLFRALARQRRPIAYAKQIIGWSRRHASLWDAATITAQIIGLSAAMRKLALARQRPKETQYNKALLTPPKTETLWVPPATKSFHDLLRNELQHTSLPRLLHYEDRNSMAHSVESRVPFLDYRLVEFVLSQPIHHLFRNGETKFILRKAMRGKLPPKVLQRQDKMGFVSPDEVWLKGNHRLQFRNAIEAAADDCQSLVNGPQILAQFDRYCAGEVGYSRLFWRVISFGDWIRASRIRT